MNKYINLIFLCVVIFIFQSCKTSEKNYRTAYEVAKDSNNSNKKIDSGIEALIAEENRGKETEINGNTVRVKTEYVSVVDDTNLKVPTYNIVVGSFKQIFNARSFRNRLKSNSVESFVVKNREQQYYVIAAGFETSEAAADYLKNINTKIPTKLPIEPFILCRAK